MLCLRVEDKNGNLLSLARGESEVNLFHTSEYSAGDKIVLESSEENIFLWLQFDDLIGKSMIYLKEKYVSYEIPFEDKKNNISKKAFSGDQHLLSVKKARDFEINQYRNLAFSVVDYHKNTSHFPHVEANVETRGEAVFAAQNAIDGSTFNSYHGNWPFQSWGINRQADAMFKLNFGRKVKVDRIIIYLRADFPHDNWWKCGKIKFSDESILDLNFIKSEGYQEFIFEEKTIEWLEFGELINSDEPSEFPALTQIEVYGVEFK